MKIFNRYKYLAHIGVFMGVVAIPILTGVPTNAIEAPAPFKDMNFYRCIKSSYYMFSSSGISDGEGVDTLPNLTDEQLQGMTKLSCIDQHVFVDIDLASISDVSGLETMPKLRSLQFWHNAISSIDVSHNEALTTLDVISNPLTSIDVSNNINLKTLSVSDDNLSSLDVSANTKLTELYVEGNPNLHSLDISNNPDIASLTADSTTFIETNVIGNKEDEVYTFDLSGLKFLDPDYQDFSYAISDTDVYTYDTENRILTVLDLGATRGYVQARGVDDDSDRVLSLCLRTETHDETLIDNNLCDSETPHTLPIPIYLDGGTATDAQDKSDSDSKDSSKNINAPSTGGNFAGDTNNANGVNIASVITYLSLALLGASVSIFAIMKLTRHHVKF
ncbi:hypothetical protein IKF26_02615 [Candidatus Saccharibacteria bacterium]|nr:hypothetical protein [Candidatus Saccharibacteria bacterium]